MKISHFDAIAFDYDDAFSHSLIGQQQRVAARRWLNEFLSGKGALRILEINCGTGEDAIWLASLGHDVLATDQSEAMIDEAKQKISSSSGNGQLNSEVKIAGSSKGRVNFVACGFAELETAFQGEQFDLIFSNFSGLNCVSPAELSELGGQFHRLLRLQGHLVVVLFGKYCWMETSYFLLKANFREAFRRWSNKEAPVRLKEAVYQPVYYYSLNRFVQILGHFQLIQKRPVGLFIPPSYLEGSMQKRQAFFRLLVRLEAMSGRFRKSSELADHMYILLQNEDK